MENQEQHDNLPEKCPPTSTAISPRLRDRILRAVGWAGGGFLFDKVIAAVQLVILARILTPADFGVMAASAAVLLAMLTISEFGIEATLIAKENVTEEDLATAWSASALRGLVLASGVWMMAGMISELMRMPLLEPLLRVHAWALIIQGLYSPALAVMMKRLDLRRRVTLDAVRRGVETTVTLTIALVYRTVWALVIGQLVALAVGCLLSFRVTRFVPHWSLRGSALSYFAHYGSRLNATTLCAFAVMTGGEFVIGRLLGAEALGMYQLAMAIPLLIGARATALMQQISVPTYASLQQDQLGLIRVFNLQVGLIGVIYIPLAVTIGTLSPVMVPVVFGPQWGDIVDPLRVLCLYAVCSGYASVMASLHYGMRRPDLQMRSWIGQCALYLAIIVPMTHWLGVLGAALSLTGSYLFGVALQAWESRRLLGSSSNDTFLSLSRTGSLGILMGMVLSTVQLQHRVFVSWTPEILGLVAILLFGGYLWWIERPRLNALWNYQSQCVRA
ncbi:MAG: oligosaccharide flippase family protein [Nitrospira sp.]|nr:oligosaccharide flippase family protein [Nitrospira sp.]